MLTDPVEFRRVLDSLSSAVFLAKRMPRQVFRACYRQFRFLDFCCFPSQEFLALLQRLMRASHDSKTSLIVLEPDPETYFHKHFGSFGVVELAADMSWDQFCSAMEENFSSSPADSLDVNSSVLALFPPSLSWIIWAERTVEMIVLAYRSDFDGPSEQSLAETGIDPLTAEDALDINSLAWRDPRAKREFAKQIMLNYGCGRPEIDRASERAIAIARKVLAAEVGLIEGCRALSSMRHEFGAEMEKQFSLFVLIDSETDDLPVGAARDLWQVDALARKDIEINRHERLHRTEVLAACKALIESLQSSQSS